MEHRGGGGWTGVTCATAGECIRAQEWSSNDVFSFEGEWECTEQGDFDDGHCVTKSESIISERRRKSTQLEEGKGAVIACCSARQVICIYMLTMLR